MNSPTISVVIVTYNSREVVEGCLNALPRTLDLEVVVVDNASSDGTDTLVSQIRDDARIVRMQENVGFAAAVNRGLSQATGDIFLLLNPDARIEPSAIEKMSALFENHQEVGVASPLVDEGDGQFRTLAAGYTPTVWRMFLHSTGISRLGSRIKCLRGHYLFRRQIKTNGLVYVDWVSGGCMFVRASVWKQLSGLSTRWFMYAEDIEFCLRVRRMGLSVVLDGRAAAQHMVGASSSTTAGVVGTAWLQNLYDLYAEGLAASRLHSAAWKWIVYSGFRGRALLLGASRIWLGSELKAQTLRAAGNRFAMYATALSRVRIRVGTGYLRRPRASARSNAPAKSSSPRSVSE